MQSATQPLSMPLAAAALQPHPGPLPITPSSETGSANAGWLFPNAPSDGLDAVRVTFTPTILASPATNDIYWAWNGYFKGNAKVYYFGLQPNGQYGKTALFSAFGDGTTPLGPACAAGADGGAGTHCHIPYPWQMGGSYQLMVRLVRGDSNTLVYEGVVADLATGAVTVIGDIGVTAADHGLLSPEGVTFEEFYARTVPCPQRPHSEALIQNVVGYRAGNPFPAALHSMKANQGCNPVFYGDGRSYVYMNNGY